VQVLVFGSVVVSVLMRHGAVLQVVVGSVM
jgi:hypothetical protein